MKNYVVEGSFKVEKEWRRFKKTIESNNEKNAKEKLYSLLGSEHRLKRNKIKISSVEEMKGE